MPHRGYFQPQFTKIGMDALKQGTDASSSCLAASWCWRCMPLRLLELGTVAARTRSTRWSKILIDFSVSTVVYFWSVTASPTARISWSAPISSRNKNGYELVKVLLPADLRRRHSRHHLGRYRRARQVLAATAGHRGHRRLDSIPSSRASPGTSISASRPGRALWASSMTSPARSWCTRWAAGSHSAPCCCWARANRYRKDGAMSAHRPRTSPSWRWAPGS